MKCLFPTLNQALRDEISLLQKQLQMAQNGNAKRSEKLKKSVSKSSINHPLDNSGDSGLDLDDLEAKLNAQSELTKSQKVKLEESNSAIKQLETMVKQLRLEKEDLTAKVADLKKTKEKMNDVKNKAESRKKMSDQLAKEVTDLKAQLAEAEKLAKGFLFYLKIVLFSYFKITFFLFLFSNLEALLLNKVDIILTLLKTLKSSQSKNRMHFSKT